MGKSKVVVLLRGLSRYWGFGLPARRLMPCMVIALFLVGSASSQVPEVEGSCVYCGTRSVYSHKSGCPYASSEANGDSRGERRAAEEEAKWEANRAANYTRAIDQARSRWTVADYDEALTWLAEAERFLASGDTEAAAELARLVQFCNDAKLSKARADEHSAWESMVESHARDLILERQYSSALSRLQVLEEDYREHGYGGEPSWNELVQWCQMAIHWENGTSLYNNEQYPEAQTEYEVAREYCPNDDVLLTSEVRLPVSDARETLETMINRCKAELHRLRGNEARKDGDIATALSEYRIMIDFDPRRLNDSQVVSAISDLEQELAHNNEHREPPPPTVNTDLNWEAAEAKRWYNQTEPEIDLEAIRRALQAAADAGAETVTNWSRDYFVDQSKTLVLDQLPTQVGVIVRSAESLLRKGEELYEGLQEENRRTLDFFFASAEATAETLAGREGMHADQNEYWQEFERRAEAHRAAVEDLVEKAARWGVNGEFLSKDESSSSEPNTIVPISPSVHPDEDRITLRRRFLGR